MKVLVTGGSGFIGSHLVEALVAKGYKVVVIDLKKFTWSDSSRVTFYEIDITNVAQLEEVFAKEQVDLVIHMAANTLLRKSLEDPISDARLNILGSITVLECCKKYGVDKFIYTSTGGARVGEPHYLPVDEKHPLNPTSPYGISKHTAEHYVTLYGELYDFDYFIFCFGNVYGPRDSSQTKRLVPVFLEKFKQGERPLVFGDGEQTRDFIYVIDLVDFMVESISQLGKTKHRLFHLANGKQVSVNEMIRLMKKISGSKIDPAYVEGIKGEVRDIVLDTTLAQKELGWNPTTDLATGIKKTWESLH